MRVLLPAVLLIPLALALGLGSRLLRAAALALAPAAALPALLLATRPAAEIQLPWLLLGTKLGVDTLNTAFLILAGLLWTAAGCYSRAYLAGDPEKTRFQFFYLLTLAGNMGLILALDMVSFYLFFTLMTFSAYGLIVHDGSAEARRAGRVYLILAVVGEALLLTAALLLAAKAGNADLRQLGLSLADHPQRDWIMGLLLFGFAIKVGIAPVHVWLPLAHSYAPTPASAVLSGIIIKAGLLGWLRFLPVGEGEPGLPGWGQTVLALGLFSTFYGVAAGLPQARPKTVLAYSSISQMGLMTSVVGIALAAPQHWPALSAILLLFILHHGLAKGALFLGAGVTAQGARWAGWLLVLPALALAGAPLTGGYLVKLLLLHDAIEYAPAAWPDRLPLLLSLSSGATALLMVRFLSLVWPVKPATQPSPWLWLSWLALLVAALELPWLWAEQHLPGSKAQILQLQSLLGSLAPLLAAAALAATAWTLWRWWEWRLPAVPEGDILALFSPRATLLPLVKGIGSWRRPARRGLWLITAERTLQQLGIGGGFLLLLGLGLLILLVTG